MSSGRRRTAVGLVDQVLSSATNFGSTVVAARSLTASDFGVFATLFAAYVVLNGVIRGFASEPLVVRSAGASFVSWQSASAQGIRRACIASVVGSLGAFGAAVLATGHERPAFIIVGCLFPLLVAQDTSRFALMAFGRPDIALSSDAIWAFTQFAGMGLLLWEGNLDFTTLVGTWAGAGAIAGMFALWRADLLSALLSSPRRRADRLMGMRFAADFLVSQGGTQLAIFFVGVFAGVTEAGHLRVAQAAFGPLVIVMAGTRIAVLPELVRIRANSIALLQRRVTQLCLVLTAAALLWGAGVAVAPSSLGHALFGDVWSEARRLTLPVTLAVAAGVAETAALCGIRAVADAKGGLRARLIVGVATIIAATLGAILAGAMGAAIGAAIAGPPGFIVWWRQFGASLRGASAARSSTIGAHAA